LNSEIDLAKRALFKGLTTLPFQVQIHFTKLNGMRCMRVLSRAQPVTFQRDVAERDAKLDVLAAQVTRTCANLAERGEYDRARAHNIAWGVKMGRAAKNEEQTSALANWRGQTETFDRSLQVQAAKVKSIKSKSPALDRSGADGAAPSAAPPAPASSSGRAGLASPSPAMSAMASPEYAVARSARSDDDFTEIAKFKNASSRAFK